MVVDTFHLRIYNKLMVGENFNELYTDLTDKHFIKIRFSTKKTAQTLSLGININELENDLLIPILGEDIVKLLDLSQLNSEIIYVKFHNKSKNLKNNFEDLKILLSENFYDTVEIIKGVMRTSIIDNSLLMSVIKFNRTYDIIMHNDYKKFAYILYKNDNISSTHSISFNGLVLNKIKSINTMQMIVENTEITKRYGGNQTNELTTIVSIEKNCNDEVVSFHNNEKYPKFLREIKLKELLDE